MSSHADTIRRFFLDRYGTDSYNVDQHTLAVIPGSHRRNPPRPHTSAGRALAALDALLAENQQLREREETVRGDLYLYSIGELEAVEAVIAIREALAGDAE